MKLNGLHHITAIAADINANLGCCGSAAGSESPRLGFGRRPFSIDRLPPSRQSLGLLPDDTNDV